jgi:hypothetical protein
MQSWNKERYRARRSQASGGAPALEKKTRQAVLSEIEAKAGVLTNEDVFAVVS